jgi:hypothetical protein
MTTAKKLHANFVKAGFSEKQIVELLNAFHEFGLIDSVKLDRDLVLIEERLEAIPFIPFTIRSGKTDFRIEFEHQARWTRSGCLNVRLGDGTRHILFTEHIIFVE